MFKVTMYKLVIFLLILMALFYYGGVVLHENFENENKVEHIRLISKLSNKALQPYKGTIETSLTVNTKKGDDFYPQLWSIENGRFRNMATNKYLTVSSDGAKVILEPLDDNKKQTWNFEMNGHIKNGDLSMNIEGANKDDEALVVVSKHSDGPAFEWYTERVLVDIKTQTILSGELSGKIEKFYKGTPKVTSSTFTYSLWLNVHDMAYKSGQWKNIFNHGSKNTSERNPGLWIVPKERKLHIRSNTSKTKNEGIDATKFTFDLDTWNHLAIVIDNKNMKFYVNGVLSEQYNFSGIPHHNGDLYLNLAGGFDGKIANVEYINKAMSPGEIIDRMKATSPEKSCKEKRPVTTLPNNMVRDLEMWRNIGFTKVRQNEECPPQKFGGNTITTTSGGKIESSIELLEKQKYEVSIWVLTSNTNGINVRPYTKIWNGDWKTVKSTNGWQNIKWEFLNAQKANTIGFEISSKEVSRNTLFMPFVAFKTYPVNMESLDKTLVAATATAANLNVNVKEYRSNGTLVTCSIKDVGLNAAQGWCALHDTRNEFYIEANLDNLYNIKSIHTRGRGDTPQWTTEYRVEYFEPYYNTWKSYGDKMEGNRDMNTVKSNVVDILTEKVRIYPISFHMWPSMRLGFSGVISKKDKCMEYKVKSEIETDLAEKEKYTTLYNKECKKISYYEYQQQEERLKRAETKYKEVIEQKKDNYKQSNKEIIETNNRTMSSKIKLDEQCEPIMPKVKSKTKSKSKSKSKSKKMSKKSKSTDHQLLQELVDEIRHINAILSNKEGKLEQINSEITLLQASGVPLDEKDKQKTLVKKKTKTETEISSLKKQLQTCQANFNISGSNSVKETRQVPVISSITDIANVKSFLDKTIKETFTSEPENKVLSCSLEQINPYDIRKHKQYQQLITDIKKKAIHQCTPFNEKDIRQHKDYPKVLQYVYQIAAEQFNDIKKHKDYTKLVSEVSRKTMEKYGKKTATGYVQCPNECQMMAEMDIRKHPKFKELIDDIVKKTAKQYGEPIPGTSPVMYRKCSPKREDGTSKQCVSHFNVPEKLVEGFSSETCNIRASSKDPFDITHHKQFPELIEKVRKNTPNVEKVKDLLEAYKKCQSENQNCSMLVKKIKEHASRNNSDITKHPEFDKYVLRSVAKGEIKKLKCELARLKHTQTKCVKKFNVENFEGTVEVENPSEAQEIVTKINKLLMDINMKSGVDDKKAFVDIKDATRKAMNSINKLSKAAANYVQEVYNDIMAVEKGEKKMSDVAKKHKGRHIDAPVASEIKKMVECEANLDKNKKAIEEDKKELEECKNDMVEKASELVKLTDDTECENPELARDKRKNIEGESELVEKKMGTLEQKYEAIKSRILEYENKNKYLREELGLLRVRCNERIQKLWTENHTMRKSMDNREKVVRGREDSLAKKRAELEEREQKLGEMKSREMEKYQYFRDRLSEERSVSNRYRAELDKLRSSIEYQGDIANNIRQDMDAKLASVREECNNRVERYRRMYGEAEKLLDELRTRSMQTPELVEKINHIENSMAKKVQTAMERTKANMLALTCPRVGKQTQQAIDVGFMEDMNKVGNKVDKLEQEVVSKVKPEDMMWYNNKFALLQ